MNKINRKYLLLFALAIFLIGSTDVIAKECIRCGGAYIPSNLVSFSSKLVGFIQVAVPIIIILTGMIELLKAVISSDEKKMDESKGSLMRKFIAGIAIFLVFVIVKFAFSMLDNMTVDRYLNCASCFINEECDNAPVVACPTRTNSGNSVSTDDSDESGSAKGEDNTNNVCKGLSLQTCTNDDHKDKCTWNGSDCVEKSTGNTSNVICSELATSIKCNAKSEYCQWTGTTCMDRD